MQKHHNPPIDMKRFFPLIALAALLFASCNKTVEVHTSVRSYCEAGYDKIGAELVALYSEEIASAQGGHVLIGGELSATTSKALATSAAQTGADKACNEALNRSFTVLDNRSCHLIRIERDNYDVLINATIDGASVVSHYFTVVFD